MSRLTKIISLSLLLALSLGCVYYNTFYHARKYFKQAESRRKEAGRNVKKVGAGDYKKAIEKSDKVIEKHPNSKWYDDALYVNGVSHFYTESYTKAEKRFRELIANFPDSKYYKDARLYLAKTKLKLDEEASAMELFELLFLESKEKEIKGQAALALGEYYFEEKKYDEAEPYFASLVDSLGNDEEEIIAQIYIADGYFNRFRYKKALDNYMETFDYALSTDDKYRVNFRIGECHYLMNDIETGMEYFDKLAEDEIYFDSLAQVRLMIGLGYEWDGDVGLAEGVYEQITIEHPRHPAAAQANYFLGLISQYEYEDYKKAKAYYDAAKGGGSASDIYQDALQRSSDIGKLEQYLDRRELDTTATEDEIDRAAETQYLLAELYLTQLGKPDSALQEFEYIIDKFPESYLAPKAIIAVAMMQRDYYSDTLAYDSTLRRVLKDYPKSDYLPEAIGLLGLAGTIADSGYAEAYYRKAENFLLKEENVDSARYYYAFVADSFPRAEINNQAKYTLLWLTETYDSPEDSSLYFSYAYFADSFPRTEFGRAASKKLAAKPKFARSDDEESPDSLLAMADSTGDVTDTTEQRYLTPEERYFINEDGNSIWEVGQPPERFDREFRYPPAAYSYEFEGFLYFQVRIDAFGDVADYKLMNPTQSEELNEEAIEVVLSAHFPTFWIPPELIDTWFVYKYEIKLPSSLR
ncbi:MAG: tetratricopeptide repeat protein [Candidatus Zixiibacteriota bacterium]|nr:MAG: tetratricopeptide repeat protein [candidate division Zixibacteria bacterium]